MSIGYSLHAGMVIVADGTEAAARRLERVLTGGELPAAVIADAVVRLLPGAIGDEQSALSDSFQDGLIEAPVYTRPEVFNGYCGAESGSVPVSAVSPAILVSEIEIEKKGKSQETLPRLPAEFP